MPYKYLDDGPTADVSFEAEGKTIGELFESAASAVTGVMIGNPGGIGTGIGRCFEVEDEDIEMLLFHFLQEIIYYKDAERLVFGNFGLDIGRTGGTWRLSAELQGEEIDPEKHELLADVKAVSLHDYLVEETPRGWRAEVILDI